MTDDPYLTPPAAAEFLTSLGIPTSKPQAYRLMNLPGCPVLRMQRKLYIRRSALLEWLRKQEDGGVKRRW